MRSFTLRRLTVATLLAAAVGLLVPATAQAAPAAGAASTPVPVLRLGQCVGRYQFIYKEPRFDALPTASCSGPQIPNNTVQFVATLRVTSVPEKCVDGHVDDQWYFVYLKGNEQHPGWMGPCFHRFFT